MYRYDTRFTPPAPVLPVFISSPSGSSQFQVEAMVDTGTEITVIPSAAARTLSLQPAYVVRARVFGGRPREAAVFAASVSLESGARQMVGVLVWDEWFALLGRDIINHWSLTLDGPGLSLTVAR